MNFQKNAQLLEITLTRNDEVFDLTDASVDEVTFVMYDSVGGTEVFRKTPESVTELGVAEFKITSDDLDIETGNYYYEVYVTYTNGDVFTGAVGNFLVKQRVDSTDNLTFSRPEDVSGDLLFTGKEYSDTDFQRKLEEANRDLQTKVGTKFINLLYADEAKQDSFVTNLHPLISVSKVYLDGEKLDSSDYTIDYRQGEITLSSSVAETVKKNTLFYIQFVPKIFADLEKWLAIENILRLQNVITASDEFNAFKSQVEVKVRKLINQINLKNHCSMLARDHYPYR